MEGGKKVSLHCVLANQKIAILWKKCVLGHEEQVIACCLTHYDYGPPKKNAFKVGSVKFANSLSPPSIVKKVRTGSKSNQGT